MTLIAEKDRQTVRDVLAREMAEDVELLLFTRDRSSPRIAGQLDGMTDEETRELLEELVGLSDRLHLTTVDLGADPTASTRLNVRAVPTVIIRRRDTATNVADPSLVDGDGTNVRFLGLPGGYEFSTLLADIVDVSKGQTSLSEQTRAAVQAIASPVHLQVFVTPT